MQTAVGSIAIAGATLAQIIHDFGSVEGDCDGLLFGSFQHQTTSSMQDDSAGPAITHEQITVRATGYYCSGSVQSFYDATGRLNFSKLTNIVNEREGRGEDPLIGWYLARRNSSLWPSMREAAVTSLLRSEFISHPLVEDDGTSNVVHPFKSNVAHIDKATGGESSSRSSSSPIPVGSNPQSGRAGASREAAAKSSLTSVPVLDNSRSPTISASPNSDCASNPKEVEEIDPVVGNAASLSTCVFVLFTETDSTNNAVRTHEYRAFQSVPNPRGISFEPLPVNIVNAGVSLRGFYDSFVPVASTPSWFNSNLNSTGCAGEIPGQFRRRGERISVGKHPGSLDNNDSGSRGACEADVASLAVEESVHAEGGLRVTHFECMYQQMLMTLESLSIEAFESCVSLHQFPDQPK